MRYVSPVNPAVYPHLAVILLGIGLFFMAWFLCILKNICTVFSLYFLNCYITAMK